MKRQEKINQRKTKVWDSDRWHRPKPFNTDPIMWVHLGGIHENK